ncbi:hypothetical protein TIFTF001_025061 [Ficus carica]|uniref:PGG domain-containing protein n=1 Tax=Ficus carica TaxID=3494 RepID=A0AA88DH48_FICCA|nr:hypothetical protein TIFTF001_025061 [Ficus carica]
MSTSSSLPHQGKTCSPRLAKEPAIQAQVCVPNPEFIFEKLDCGGLIAYLSEMMVFRRIDLELNIMAFDVVLACAFNGCPTSAATKKGPRSRGPEMAAMSNIGPSALPQEDIKKIQKSKEKHVWAVQVLNELLKHSTMYFGNEELRLIQRSKDQTKGNFHDNFDDDDSRDKDNSDEEFYRDNISESSKISEQPSYYTNISEAAGNEVCSRKETKPNDTPILLAAKYGIAEMVEKILEHFPVAIYDVDKDSKTVLLMAVEKRNLQVYKILIKRYFRKDYVFHKMDEKGNNALHYAAMYDEEIKPWPVPGAALQMQWEIKWHEFVENTMPPRLYLRTNKDGQTPKEMFSHTHKDLVKAGGKWLTSTATSCSVVATLIATVAFASSADAPGGTDNKSGKPNLEKNPTFELFAISSLIALCFSVTSLIMFLAILTSRHQEKDFGETLPRKILFGLTSLFVSIASMLVTFCAGHFLVFENKFKYAALPVYAVTLLPLCLFAAAQFPLYFDLLMATFWSPF